MYARVCPPIVPNCPAAYTVPPLTASPLIGALALGFHGVTAPVAALSAAMLFLTWPPAETMG
jgi:hypothetical protein